MAGSYFTMVTGLCPVIAGFSGRHVLVKIAHERKASVRGSL